MNELWFQQNFLNNRISIRLGQLGADSQFDVSTYDTGFSMQRLDGHRISLRTSQMEALVTMGAPGVQLALSPLNWPPTKGLPFRAMYLPRTLIGMGSMGSKSL